MNGLGCQQSNPSYSTRNRETRGGFDVFKQVGSQEPASVQFTMALNTVLISLAVTHSGGTFSYFSKGFFLHTAPGVCLACHSLLPGYKKGNETELDLSLQNISAVSLQNHTR